MAKPIYHSCELFLTGPEIDSFIEQTEFQFQSQVDAAILSQEVYLRRVRNPTIVACAIKRIDRIGPRYAAARAELEKLYFDMTLEVFHLDDWEGYLCDKLTDDLVLDGRKCSDYQSVDEVRDLAVRADKPFERDFYTSCFAKKRFEDSIGWFERTKARIDMLVLDVQTLVFRDKWKDGQDLINRLDDLKYRISDSDDLIKAINPPEDSQKDEEVFEPEYDPIPGQLDDEEVFGWDWEW